MYGTANPTLEWILSALQVPVGSACWVTWLTMVLSVLGRKSLRRQAL
jgi:hypothetical protein